MALMDLAAGGVLLLLALGLGFLLGRVELCIPGHLRNCGDVGVFAVQQCAPSGYNYGPCREVGE